MDETRYLCVDKFLTTLAGARALTAALELGLVDLLLLGGHATGENLAEELGTDAAGMGILLDLLTAGGVVEKGESGYGLTPAFAEALEFRDLLEVKLAFSNLCARDLLDHFTHLVSEPSLFHSGARLFKLFDYSRAWDTSTKNLEEVWRWMRITTTLTKYEAPVVVARHDFSRYRRILDIGGNSGEFVLNICRLNPEARATVLDLPAVCEEGRRYIRDEPEAGRIEFVEGNALSDDMPSGYDLVTFKSVLHDWPEEETRQLLTRAANSLEPGGTMLIFERGPIKPDDGVPPYSLVPFLLFARFFREPDLYVSMLDDLGFTNISVNRVPLEMTFNLVTAIAPG